MAEDERPRPAAGEAARARRAAERERLAASLRENLQKRKRQSRERAEPEHSAEE